MCVDLLLVPVDQLALPNLRMILLVHLVDAVAHPLYLPVQALPPQGRRLEGVVAEDEPVEGLPLLGVTVGGVQSLGTRGVATEAGGRLVGRGALVVSR